MERVLLSYFSSFVISTISNEELNSSMGRKAKQKRIQKRTDRNASVLVDPDSTLLQLKSKILSKPGSIASSSTSVPLNKEFVLVPSSSQLDTKWDELQIDCLVTIFSKLNTEDIAESVQFVCKSWHKATLDPTCWRTLTFMERCSDNFVEFAVRRSQNSVICIIFGQYYRALTERNLLYISQNCPELKLLCLPFFLGQIKENSIRKAIPNWKKLEYIGLWNCDDFGDILESISMNCKKFTGFIFSSFVLGDEEASLIVEFLPKIKVLAMPHCGLVNSSLVMILKCCRELEYVDISNCMGFEMDDEVRKLASNIKTFYSRGLMCYDDVNDYDFDNNKHYDVLSKNMAMLLVSNLE